MSSAVGVLKITVKSGDHEITIEHAMDPAIYINMSEKENRIIKSMNEVVAQVIKLKTAKSSEPTLPTN